MKKKLVMEKLNMYLFRRNDRVRRFKPSYFQNRRWRHLTLLEKLSGFWPYQSKLQEYQSKFFHSFVLLIALSAAANKLLEYVGVDNSVTIECCLFMFIFIALFVTLILTSIHRNSRRKAYERIVKHFETISDAEEVVLLNEGAERGFNHTLYYACTASIVVAIFTGVPVLQSLCGYLFDRREFKMQMPVPLNFGFDHSKYWYVIVIIVIMWSYSALLVNFVYNLSFLLQVRHAAALFEIVGIRLRKASELVNEFEDENGNTCDDATDQSYSIISSAIVLHSECFELVKLIEESYSTCWLVILLLSTGSFGAGVHLVSTKVHDLIEAFRYASVFLIVVLHFHMVFSHGQLIIDSAKSVSDACGEFKWYGLPKKSCKLLSMMMIRTSIPCQITGAKLFPLSMESFGKMLKAGLSYYSVFRAKSG